MESEDYPNGISAAIRAGAGLAEPHPIPLPDGGLGIIVPDGFELHKVPALDPVLTRVKAAPRFDDRDSFIAYINRFKNANTVVFADMAGNKMAAVIDYHAASEGGPSAADHCVHKAVHPCPWSIDWARWRAQDGKNMSQAELGYFLEEMLHTIAAPDGAGLIEVATELKVDRAVKFKSGTRLQDGTNSLIYEEEDQTSGRGGKIAVPDTIKIAAPVFMGADPTLFSARLRYRIEKGVLTFKIDIMNRLDGEQAAFRAVVDQVRDATSQPVFYGAQS